MLAADLEGKTEWKRGHILFVHLHQSSLSRSYISHNLPMRTQKVQVYIDAQTDRSRFSQNVFTKYVFSSLIQDPSPGVKIE